MQFFYESQEKEVIKAFTTEKNIIAVLLLFYDLKYINSTKKQFSNQKSGMVFKVTFVLNLKINIVTKFQVSI